MATRRKSRAPYVREQKILFGMIVIVLILFGGYVYFVSATVTHVIARKEIDQNISKLSTEISELEARFIVAKQSITKQDIALRGFEPESAPRVYVRKTPSTLVLVVNDES